MIDKQFLRQKYKYKEGFLYSKSGKRIGCHIKSERYVKCHIKGKNYYLHRLVWIYHFGDIQEGYHVDHIDRNKRNNNISNLRAVKPEHNQFNKTPLKYNGVYQRRDIL